MFNVIKAIMSDKNQKRLRHRARQRQKLSYRTVFLVSSSCITLLVIGWVIFFNVAKVERTMARAANTELIGDQQLVNEMTIPAPIINTSVGPDENTIQMRRMKE